MKYNALFIGLTTVDIQYFVDEYPERNVKIKTNPPDILVGGPAANAAVAFSLLNSEANVATAIGENSFSSFIKEDFCTNNIHINDIIESKKINPVVASVVTSLNGERNIFTHNPAEITDYIEVEVLFTNVKPQIVFIDGFYPEFSLECVMLAKRLGIPVVADCGSWKPQYTDLLKYTDVAICSADFIPPGCGKETSQIFDFVKSLGVNKIAISRGSDSILVKANNNSLQIPVQETVVIDTLGAGDFLHGAFCYYYLESNNFTIALKKASELATFSCQFKGTRKWLNFWQ